MGNPIRVQVKGAGIVEFPEGTTQDQMTAALKKLQVNVGEGAEFSVNGETVPSSAFGRFTSSAWQNVNPITAVQGLGQAVWSPWQTLKAVGNASASNYAQAKEEQAKRIAAGGVLPSGPEVEHSLGAIPLVGPALQEVAEKVNTGDYAGAAGSATGLAVPYLRPVKSLAAMATPTARAVLGAERSSRVANVVQKVAQNKIVEAIAPQVGQNKPRFGKDAARIAQTLIDRGLSSKWSREGVHAAVIEALDVASSKLDDAADARATWKDFDTAEIVKALEAKKTAIQSNPIEASRFPRRIDPETKQLVVEPYGEAVTAPAVADRVAQIDAAINRVKTLGPSVRYEAVKRLRQGFDTEAKAYYHPSTTQDYIKNMSRQTGAADVTGALREFLAGKDPATAAANAEWSLMKRAKDVLDATEEVERARPKAGRKIMSRVAGSIAGSEIAGLAGAMAGWLLAPAADVSIGMGVTTKLKWAGVLDKVAKAVRSGNQPAVNFYAGQLKRTLAQAGVMVQRGVNEGMEKPYEMPTPVASHATTQGPTPPPSVLDDIAPGRHTLSDGTVWDKLPDGSVRQVK